MLSTVLKKYSEWIKTQYEYNINKANSKKNYVKQLSKQTIKKLSRILSKNIQINYFTIKNNLYIK